MIDAAIVGVGRWGRMLVDAVQGQSDKIRFARAVAHTPAKAADYCAEKGMALGGDYAEALSDSKVKAVVLTTPHSQHAAQIAAAAKAGKHVFVEKPLTLTRASAAKAVADCHAAGVTLGVGLNRRFYPATREIKRMIEAGELGAPLHVEGNFSANLAMAANTWRADRKECPAGGMTSLGIHVLDAMIMLCGRIRILDAKSTRRALPYDVDDVTTMLLTFESGMTGYLATLQSTAHLFYLRVFGTKGWVLMPDYDTLVKQLGQGKPETVSYPSTPTLKLELESFAAACEGGAPYPITADEMVHGISALEAISASAARGSPCQVD
jgi:predicted dehydrogenase